jgi:hypothetical protein
MRNTNDVVLLSTSPFFISREKSRKGCITDGPFLPAQNDLTRFIIPIKKKGNKNINARFMIVCILSSDYPE